MHKPVAIFLSVLWPRGGSAQSRGITGNAPCPAPPSTACHVSSSIRSTSLPAIIPCLLSASDIVTSYHCRCIAETNMLLPFLFLYRRATTQTTHSQVAVIFALSNVWSSIALLRLIRLHMRFADIAASQ